MKIKSAVYTTSVVESKKLIKDGLPQLAFVGRSNVGKSSLINALTGQKALAKTSSTPGLTKMVNYFLINNEFYFVDLPGYGYAKVAHENLKVWGSLMGSYLKASDSLVCVFVLIDLRIPPSELDKEMIKYLEYYGITYKILGTKADKLSKSALNVQIKSIAKELNARSELILPVSSKTRQGIDKLLEYIGASLEMAKNE